MVIPCLERRVGGARKTTSCEDTMTYEDPNDAPKADSTHYYKCDHCEHLHMILVDEIGRTYVTAIISRDMLIHMLEVIDGGGDGTKNQTGLPM